MNLSTAFLLATLAGLFAMLLSFIGSASRAAKRAGFAATLSMVTGLLAPQIANAAGAACTSINSHWQNIPGNKA